MMRDSCRDGPAWWPSGEPWPPRHRAFGMHRRARARFFRRVALAAAAVVAIAIAGMFAAAWLIADRLALAGWTATIPTLLVLFGAGIVLTSTFGAMRRLASPLGAVMDAADRVADGDYGVRVREYGPPPMRALARSFNTMTERLQNADRLRRDLMADVAHELRTPLSVLQGRLEGLIDGVYPRDDRQLSQLLEETQVLSTLIEDLRTLALSDAGALQLQKESTDIVALVQEVARSMQPEAAGRSVSLRVTASTDDAVLEVDPMRIREVLTNLLSNALRHTTAGSVTVSVGSTNSGVAVAVADTGEGMPADEVARIFDRFYRGSTSRGSGLGLTIAKGIVTAHGGEISASSHVDEGTTVTFTLPRRGSDS
jgi:signal transduction histidine kinase